MGSRTTQLLQELGLQGLRGEAGMLGQVSSTSSQHTPASPPTRPAVRTLYLPGGEKEGEERGAGGRGQGTESSPTYSE